MLPLSFKGNVTVKRLLKRIVFFHWAPSFSSIFVSKFISYILTFPFNSLAPGTGSHLSGLGLYLAVNALNFAEADRPKKRLPGPVVSEIYCSLGLQSSLSLPHLSSLALVSTALNSISLQSQFCMRISGLNLQKVCFQSGYPFYL